MPSPSPLAPMHQGGNVTGLGCAVEEASVWPAGVQRSHGPRLITSYYTLRLPNPYCFNQGGYQRRVYSM